MRSSLAVPVLAGLLFGWAALAQADAPPAAPIFYCPTPAKAPAATGRAAAAPPAAASPHSAGCPVARVAVAHHSHWRAHPAPRHRVVVARGGGGDNGVAASQAFIYRYERAMHGFDAGVAQRAWAEGRSPCPPHRDHCWAGPAHAAGPLAGPGPMVQAGPPPHGMPPGPPPGPRSGPPGPPPGAMHAAPPPEFAGRPAPPPCTHGCPDHGWAHAGPPPAMAEAAPRMPPPRPSAHAYAWNGGHSGYAMEAEGMSREREGGWSYSEVDGHARFHRWGDRFPGEPGMGDHWAGHAEGHWGGHPRPCPSACARSPGGPPPADIYEAAGRDAAGFLTWPGKTPAAW